MLREDKNRLIVLHWLCDAPSPYNTQLFQAIAETPTFRLQVHYRRLSLCSHPWQSNLTEGYRWRVFKEPDRFDWGLIRLSMLRRRFLERQTFVVGGWNHPTALLLLFLLSLRKANVILWTDTPDMARTRNGLYQLLRMLYLKWVFRRVRYVMGTGTPALEALGKIGVSDEKLLNFPYWIDVDRYAPANVDRNHSRAYFAPVVFLSSGIVKNSRKGHDVAVRAFAEVAKQCSVPFEYRIAGVGPDADALQALANSLGVGDRVTLLGWVEPADLVIHLHESDVFIHPSSAHEPYGVAILEAMAAGLPVLASDMTCAGLDRIVPNVNGLVHRAGDSEQLAKQIIQLLEVPYQIVQMRISALQTASAWPMSRAIKILKEACER